MPPPKPSEDRDTVPTAMDHVIATGLAKQPTDRYQSTVEMAAAARHAITEPTAHAHADPAFAKPWPSSGESPPAPAQFGGPLASPHRADAPASS